MKICEVCRQEYEENVVYCAKDGEVLELKSNSLVGQVFDGQYLIETRIGLGGMGKVYRASHTMLKDCVAIKTILPGLHDAQFRERFLREGQAARRIKHPNVVSVYDLRTTGDGTVYMVMEYVEGQTLKREIEEPKRFSHSEALRLLEPIGDALNEAHSKGIVHRDLKPENILVGKKSDGSYTVKLLDLGLAKMLPTEDKNYTTAGLTVTGQPLGTPLYMPPEQWAGGDSEFGKIDGRSDIYSLGIIFYEMIAGVRPFIGPTIQNLLMQHLAEIPKPLHEIVADVPRAFSLAIARAMAKDPAQRQQTVSELFQELRHALIPTTGQSVAIDNAITLVGPKEKFLIKHTAGSKAGKTEEFFTEDLTELTFGRDPSSAVKFDPYKDDLVARRQAIIKRSETDSARFTITDLNSQNGTFVNKERITGTVELKPGNMVQFGMGGPIFEFDLEPKPIPRTRSADLIPETRPSSQLPPTRTAGTSFPPTRLDDPASRSFRQRLVIKHLNGSKAGMVEEVLINNLSEIHIGRDPRAAIKYDPQKDDLVSFQHAKILPKATGFNQFIIVDLNSRNGTFVNNLKISSGTEIKPGDIIQLGLGGPSFEFGLG